MVLSGVGDAFAYKQGDWEFCHSGEAIYKEVTEMGGVEKIKVKCKIMVKRSSRYWCFHDFSFLMIK